MKRNLAILSILLAAGIGAFAQQTTKLSKDQVRQTVKQLSAALLATYVFPEKAENASVFLHSKIDSGLYDNIPDPNLLASTLASQLKPLLGDKHFRVVYNPLLEKEILSYNNSLTPPAGELQSEMKKNFYFRKVEMLPGNIG
ncbi:hypothetical protein ACS5PU_16320 [Pedobacter sp. GSP4]|uniref:hypothetical protein n=1 Tax=Pedobacter sp. GSP4 TaxID=3453716 RepID=UPI003EEFBDFF